MSPTTELVAPFLLPSGMQEICAGYFETHISPMLKTMQKTQELMNEKLEDNYTTLQELASEVHQKADASDVARLAALVESIDGMSPSRSIKVPVSPQTKFPSQMQRQDRVGAFEEKLLQECMDRFEERVLLEADKAEREHDVILAQLQEMTIELVAVTAFMAEHKVEASTASIDLEGNRVEAKQEQVEPTGQEVTKPCLSQILKSKLTIVEEDNQRLDLEVDAAMKQLGSVSTAMALGIEAPLPTISDAAMWQHVKLTRASQDGNLQLVEPTGQDASKRNLSKILKIKLTNVEEENERLQQEHEDISKKLMALTSMIDTTDSV